MKIVGVSIRQPVFITMIVFLIVVLGTIGYFKLGVDLMPDIALPIVAVTTVYPGVGPEEMESQVTKPIEDALSSINGLKKLSSTSAEGVSLVTAEFNMEVDADKAATNVREKISSIRNTLPDEVLEPIIDKFDSSAAPVMSLNVSDPTGTRNLSALRDVIDDQIKPLIEQVSGVGGVTVLGGLEREIHVDADIDRLHALGMPIAVLSSAIAGENLNLPAGSVSETRSKFLLRTKAEFERVDELRRIIVGVPGGAPVYLKDVAAVSDGFKTRTAISRLNGTECISVVVRRQSGSNTVKVADDVRKVLRRIAAANPGLDIRPTIDTSEFIKESRDDVVRTLLLAFLLTGLVVFFSFGDLRNTLITIAGIPVCLAGTFAVMSLLGYTINVISLMALSLSIGLLVDDAIVVRENIFRHMERFGDSPMQAALTGTSEVGLAVLATTFTLVSVFLPVAFSGGITGKFFREFGVTIAVAVLISLLEAFTLAPMLSAYFFRPVDAAGRRTLGVRFQEMIANGYGRLAEAYKPLIRWALGHRKTVALATTVIFVISGMMIRILGTGGSPAGSRPELNMNLQLPSGSSLENSDAIMRRVEALLRSQPEISDIYTVVGTADGASDEATVYARLRRGVDSKTFRDRLRPQLAVVAGIVITYPDQAAIGGSASNALRQLPIQINLKGTNLASLTAAAETVQGALQGIPGLVDIGSDYRAPKPEVRILIDRERAARLGVGTFAIASTMRALVDGRVSSQFRTGEKLVDIRVRAAGDYRENLERLARAYIPAAGGGSVRLDQVARLEPLSGPTQIKRKDRIRQIIVAGNVLKGFALNEIELQARQRIAARTLPGDVTFEFGGQVEQNAEMFTNLFIALILAVLLIYMILASQFGSFLQPFAIMLALPLSLIGAVLGLMMGNKLFDMVAFIGLIMLMGIVVKNSILLVDYTNVLRREKGMARAEAIVLAGATRLRPILMTTFATILGMVPVAFSLGASSDFRAPIGYTIIGGLISSTLLTLVIVPVVYSVIDDIGARFKRRAVNPVP